MSKEKIWTKARVASLREKFRSLSLEKKASIFESGKDALALYDRVAKSYFLLGFLKHKENEGRRFVTHPAFLEVVLRKDMEKKYWRVLHGKLEEEIKRLAAFQVLAEKQIKKGDTEPKWKRIILDTEEGIQNLRKVQQYREPLEALKKLPVSNKKLDWEKFRELSELAQQFNPDPRWFNAKDRNATFFGGAANKIQGDILHRDYPQDVKEELISKIFSIIALDKTEPVRDDEGKVQDVRYNFAYLLGLQTQAQEGWMPLMKGASILTYRRAYTARTANPIRHVLTSYNILQNRERNSIDTDSEQDGRTLPLLNEKDPVEWNTTDPRKGGARIEKDNESSAAITLLSDWYLKTSSQYRGEFETFVKDKLTEAPTRKVALFFLEQLFRNRDQYSGKSSEEVVHDIYTKMVKAHEGYSGNLEENRTRVNTGYSLVISAWRDAEAEKPGTGLMRAYRAIGDSCKEVLYKLGKRAEETVDKYTGQIISKSTLPPAITDLFKRYKGPSLHGRGDAGAKTRTNWEDSKKRSPEIGKSLFSGQSEEEKRRIRERITQQFRQDQLHNQRTRQTVLHDPQRSVENKVEKKDIWGDKRASLRRRMVKMAANNPASREKLLPLLVKLYHQ